MSRKKFDVIEEEDFMEVEEEDGTLSAIRNGCDRIFKASRLIWGAFRKAGLICDIKTYSDVSCVTLATPGHHTRMVADFLSQDDDNDVHVRFNQIVTVPEEKLPAVLVLVNKLNDKYRTAKFVLDDRRNLNLEMDFLMSIRDEDLGRCALESYAKLSQTIDEVYPALMELIWA